MLSRNLEQTLHRALILPETGIMNMQRSSICFWPWWTIRTPLRCSGPAALISSA